MTEDQQPPAENRRDEGRRKAVALRYNLDKDEAPKILAKGAGHLAERIIELAQEQGIPLHEDPDLVGLLSKLELGTEIPEQLYAAVAEVLAFIYRLNQQMETPP